MWIAISCASSVTVSALLAWLIARRVVRDAASSVAKARSVVSRTESCEASVSELADLVRDLSNQLKMQRVRRAGLEHATSNGQDNSLPDPVKDPEGWRKQMNRRIGRAKVPAVTGG